MADHFTDAHQQRFRDVFRNSNRDISNCNDRIRAETAGCRIPVISENREFNKRWTSGCSGRDKRSCLSIVQLLPYASLLVEKLLLRHIIFSTPFTLILPAGELCLDDLGPLPQPDLMCRFIHGCLTSLP